MMSELDLSPLPAAQQRKIRSILRALAAENDALLLDVDLPARLSEGTVCLSVLARINRRQEVAGPKTCFIEPEGRHHWIVR